MKSFVEHLNEDCGCSHEKEEMKLVGDVRDADRKDREELPGSEGERNHENLHTTIARFIQKMKEMHEAKDGDYEDAPPENPMTDEELEKYYQAWKASKNK